MRIKKIAPVTPANGNIENSYGTSQTDTYSQEYINNIPKVLWTNTDLATNFVGQKITNLAEDIENFKYYEIIYLLATDSDWTLSSGKIPVGRKGVISLTYITAYRRRITAMGGRTMTFDDCIHYTQYGNASSTAIMNGNIQPYQILGYR